MKLQELVNKKIGTVVVETPVEYTDQSFECAAWWESSIAGSGTFDAFLREDPHNKGRYYVTAELPATITADFFPSLWGGSLIGKPYDSKENAGKPARRAIRLRTELPEAICNSCTICKPDGRHWEIDKEVWRVAEAYYREKVKRDGESMANYFAKWQAGPEDRFLSKIGMVGYAAGQVAKYVKAVEVISRHCEFHKIEPIHEL